MVDDNTAHRLCMTHALLEEYERNVKELSAKRRALMQALLDDGWTQTDIAKMLGITRSRISILVRKDDPN